MYMCVYMYICTCITEQNDNIKGHHAEDHQNEEFILDDFSVLLGEENKDLHVNGYISVYLHEYNIHMYMYM